MGEIHVKVENRQLAERIEKRAAADGVSLNVEVEHLLEIALSLSSNFGERSKIARKIAAMSSNISEGHDSTILLHEDRKR